MWANNLWELVFILHRIYTYGHKNILKYCNRPFQDVEEMNSALIENWNSVVTGSDLVYVLGDFALCSFDDAKSFFDQLNGEIIMAGLGNHDKSRETMLRMGFKDVWNHKVIQYEGLNIALSHYPTRETLEFEGDKRKHYHYKGPLENVNLLLHGHVHSTPDRKIKLQGNLLNYDVGVDANNYAPVLISDIVTEASNFLVNRIHEW